MFVLRVSISRQDFFPENFLNIFSTAYSSFPEKDPNGALSPPSKARLSARPNFSFRRGEDDLEGIGPLLGR